jgi:hypothetical protein
MEMKCHIEPFTETENRVSFASSCVEMVAKRLQIPYSESYQRLKAVGLIDAYLKKLDPLHTQSREYATNEVVSALLRLEKESDSVYNKGDTELTMSANETTVRDIILWNRIGRMIPIIAERLKISIERAFDIFYTSRTCARLHDESTGLYLFSDLYIIDDLMMELSAGQE